MIKKLNQLEFFLKQKVHLIMLFICIGQATYAQNVNLAGVINRYALVQQIPEECKLVVDSVQYFSVGDEFLLIQMKGGQIDQSGTPAYGDVTDYEGAGNYEICTIQQISLDTLILTRRLVNSYQTNALQAIHFEPASNATVTSTVTAPAWDGIRGGVVFINVDDTIRLNAGIDVTGRGYRGGSESEAAVNCGQTFFQSDDDNQAGQKGESFIPYSAFQYGRGALAIGGGGGNNHNTGGGGGGNYGRGGRGGDEYANGTGACVPNLQSGGEGGKIVSYSANLRKAFMGGGGGGAHQNDYANDPRDGSRGVRGGGLVIINSDFIESSGATIKANGLSQDSLAGRDGAGGGGAGGSVLIATGSIIGPNLNIEVNGGDGGDLDNNNFNNICHGPGGGGGGGILWLSAPTLQGSFNLSASGGSHGIIVNPNSSCFQSAFGSTSGMNGGARTDLEIPRGTVPCEGAILEITATDDTATTGGNIPVVIDVQFNDTSLTDFTTSIISGPSNGSASVINGDSIQYIPNAGFVGTDTIVYIICLDFAPNICDTATVIIDVIQPNAEDDFDTTYVNTSISLNILLNDIVFDSSYTTVISPFNFGSFSYLNGQLLYIPNQGFTGNDTLTYINCFDPQLLSCDTAQVIITVIGIEANDDSDTATAGVPILIDVLDNDVFSLFVTIAITCEPANGSVVINSSPPGVIYESDPGFSGLDTFCYSICINDTCDTAVVSVFIETAASQDIVIPTGFSPNGDGINDFWVIPNIELAGQSVVRIYNRWGEEIYGKENYRNTWQGTNFIGNPLPDGTYFYFVELVDRDEKYSGYVVIHR